MLRRFGWFYHALGLGFLLRRIEMDDLSIERIREASERGPVVYVLLQGSVVDYLALNTALNRTRLPLSVWANGITNFYWQPLANAWGDVGRRLQRLFRIGPTPDPVASGWVRRTVLSSTPITLFIRRARLAVTGSSDGQAADTIDAVLSAQQQSERPVQLVPVVVVWNRAPDVKRTPTMNFLLGTREQPGRIEQVINLYTRSKNAFIQAGEPVDLATFTERVPEPRQSDTLRTLLRRYLKRESNTVRGPQKISARLMRGMVLDNPPMRELAVQEATASGRSVESVRKEMEKDLRQISAKMSWRTIRILDVVLRPLWTRVYAGVDVRPEDMDRIRTAARNGSAILVPCHKSHFDYLLMSWVLYDANLVVPHVVAGMNLAIWPVSVVLRAAGAVFIKRSFTGERIFPAVFSRYLRELIRHGYTLEFFIEGGRSRSGKLMRPKIGVLGMVVDAAEMRDQGTEVTLLPISLCYEQVAEAGAYARELGGEHKRPESLGQVVKARSVLRRRFGRVYMRVGEPVRCSEFIEQSEGWSGLGDNDRREKLQVLGERLIYRIGENTIVLPTSLIAAAALCHHRRGMKEEVLFARVERFREFLKREGAMEAASLGRSEQALREALERCRRQRMLVEHEHADGRVWSIPADQRLALDFHKNQILQFFATAGLAACAIRALPDAPFTTDDARSGFLFLAWILRREFILDPDTAATDQLIDGLGDLEAHGALRREEGAWVIADEALIGEVYGMFRPLLEAYAAVLKTVEQHATRKTAMTDLAKAIRDDGEALQSTGVISRPEALSTVTLRNAVNILREEGVLQATERRHVRVDIELRDALLATLRGMVD